jgi:hypothetical protein
VWLCETCHIPWAHHHPFAARASGFIVARYVSEPGTVPIDTCYGKVLFDCEGGYVFVSDDDDA